MYDRTKIPATIEELIKYGWDGLMRKKIASYKLYDINSSVDDIMQDMYVQMLRTDFLGKYDPNGRAFEVYLVVFIRNFMNKLYKRENTSKHGKDILFAKGIDNTAAEDNEGNMDTAVISMEHMQDDSANFESFLLLVESLREELKQFKANSSVEYNGVTLDRDPATVFELIKDGYAPKDIAEMFETSDAFIYLLLKKIRACSCVSDYTKGRSKKTRRRATT